MIFHRKVLFVTRSKTPEGESREIPLTARLFRWLSENRRDHGIVFAYEGEQVRIIKRSWKTALKNAGIRHLRFHDLRHTFNTRLMEAGVLQEIRMALMGHSSGSKVHATYTHIELPAKREAIRKLEAWVNQQQEQLKQQQEQEINASTETERDRNRQPRQKLRVANRGRRKRPWRWSWNKPTSSRPRSPKRKKSAQGQTAAACEVRRSQEVVRGDVAIMELLPNELKCRLPPIHSQDDEMLPMVYARYSLSGYTGSCGTPLKASPDADDYHVLRICTRARMTFPLLPALGAGSRMRNSSLMGKPVMNGMLHVSFPDGSPM